jgi:hypothetical protein
LRRSSVRGSASGAPEVDSCGFDTAHNQWLIAARFGQVRSS